MFEKRSWKSELVFLVLAGILLGTLGCAGAPEQPTSAAPSPEPAPVLTPLPPVPPPPPPAPPPPPTIKYAAIVVLQNKIYEDVIGSPDMPYLNSLATQFGVASNYFANGHQGLPDSFALTTGDTIASDAAFNDVVTHDNIVRQLVANNKTWKCYAEALPSAGYLGPDQGPYSKAHDPFAYFSDVVDTPAQAANIVPFTQFATDLAAGTLPNYMYIFPDNFNNGHDCPVNLPTCTIDDVLQNTDKWLQTNIDPLLKNQDFHDRGILIITFDESKEDDLAHGGGHVPWIIAGAKVKTGYVSNTLYQHESTLRLMMKALGLTSYPGGAASAPDMDEFFTGPLP